MFQMSDNELIFWMWFGDSVKSKLAQMILKMRKQEDKNNEICDI